MLSRATAGARPPPAGQEAPAAPAPSPLPRPAGLPAAPPGGPTPRPRAPRRRLRPGAEPAPQKVRTFRVPRLRGTRQRRVRAARKPTEDPVEVRPRVGRPPLAHRGGGRLLGDRQLSQPIAGTSPSLRPWTRGCSAPAGPAAPPQVPCAPRATAALLLAPLRRPRPAPGNPTAPSPPVGRVAGAENVSSSSFKKCAESPGRRPREGTVTHGRATRPALFTRSVSSLSWPELVLVLFCFVFLS